MPTMDEIEAMIIGPPKKDRDDETDVLGGLGGKKPRGVVNTRVIEYERDDETELDEEAEEGEDELVVNRPTSVNDDDDEPAEVNSDNLYLLLLAFQKDKNLVDDVYVKLREMYDAYTTNAFINYSSERRKNFIPQLMFKLRVFVQRNMADTGDWNFVFLQRTEGVKGSLKEFTTFNMSTSLTMRERLKAEKNVLVFSMNDVVCLAYAVKYQKNSLAIISGYQNREQSIAELQRLVTVLENAERNVIANKLRPLDGTMAALKNTGLLLAGEPIAVAVDKYHKILQAHSQPNADRGYVAIYFDFDKLKLFTVNAKDVEVPSSTKLDESYAMMRQHPRRLILLDTRSEYKTRRGWQ